MDITDMLCDAVTALRHHRFLDPVGAAIPDMQATLAKATPVNCQPIYDDLTDRGEGVDMYDECIVRPPWANVTYCYKPNTPTPTVMMIHVVTLARSDYPGAPEWEDALTWESTADTHVIDWNAVEYVSLATVHAWRPGLPGVAGPLHSWKWAADEDGTMLDIYNQQIDPRLEDPDFYVNGLLTTLKALTFLNCRNVTLVEPHRPRAQRRRLERAGVRISEIHVFPSGTTVRGQSMPVGAGGRPLHSVRGHIARYGPKWGRGLLFGKIEGEFWIPQHARGAAEHGTTDQHITLEGTPA